jgi:hypothetical protein
MEENIQKILQEKDENVVQFNVTNTTPNPIFIDLFDSANLSPVATSLVYSNLPNTPVATFGSLPYQWQSINPNNGYLYATDGTNTIQVFDTNNGNIFVTNIICPSAVVLTSCYNSINNTLYFIDVILGNIYVVDATTNSITATLFSIGGSGSLIFIPSSNTIYVTNSLGVTKIDCATNITSSVFGFPQFDDYAYNPNNGLVYATYSPSNYFVEINPFTDTIIQTITSPNAQIIQINTNLTTPFIYVTDVISNDINVYNWNTGFSFITTIIYGIAGISYGVYDITTNSVYFGSATTDILIIDGTNNLQLAFVGLSLSTYIVLNTNTNSIYVATPFINAITQLTTIGITATPFYISGSANYNAFVNNLNNEPAFIQMIRLFTQNQNQLTNELQLTTIDSNGNQIFMPNFPINQVSAYQQQGNIGEIALKDVVFDGRTYINNYQLNAYESMSFEIYYKQLDLTSATPNLPMFFKPKVQLKEYIKKELNL